MYSIYLNHVKIYGKLYIYMVKFWLSKISKDIKLVLVFSNYNFVFWLYVDSKRKAFPNGPT